MTRISLAALLFVAFAASVLADEPAARVTFHENAEVRSRVVLLADVADVESEDAELAERLLQTELVAAPSAGQIRSLRQRELIDHLQLNGFNLRKLEFSGAAITHVSYGPARRDAAAPPTTARLAAAQRRIKQAVVGYLRSAQPAARRGEMEIECDDAACNAAAALASTISVVEAEEVAAATYNVVIAIASKGKVEEFKVVATLNDDSRVVVAARPLRAGQVLTAADLKLSVPRSDAEAASAATSIEDLIGRELTRSVGVDQIVPAEFLVQPRLVRKGDIVEVTARSGGVRVTTQAVAQEDGSLGDVISLEPVDAKAKPGQKVKDLIRAQVVAQGQAQIDITRPSPRPAASQANNSSSSNRVGVSSARLGSRPTRSGSTSSTKKR